MIAMPEMTSDREGTVHVPAYDVPFSVYMSPEAQKAYLDQSRIPPPPPDFPGGIREIRAAFDSWLGHSLRKAQATYATIVEEAQIGGVRTYVVTPKEGVSTQNQNRILVNLHGGALRIGAGPLQLIESIPIAATARIKVVSVDYRMAPEHRFPAASEDVASVYRALLKQYRPQDIGIYGHSAGGGLVEMAMAWFLDKRLPLPGAIGVFSAANLQTAGDSRYFAAPLAPFVDYRAIPPAAPNPPPIPFATEYFAGANLQDRLAAPGLYPEVLARFPPTLLVTGTRDFLLSSVVNTHRQLVQAEVQTQLHVWDGMWHGFIQEVDIPESREMYAVTARFFDARLGGKP